MKSGLPTPAKLRRKRKHIFQWLLFAVIPCCIVLLMMIPGARAHWKGFHLPGHDTTDMANRFHPAKITETIDSIVVVKKYRHMFVFNNSKLLKVYHISLGESPVGPKRFQDDRKTPEGLYFINGKNPNSMAHKSVGISYPNDSDRKYARSFGKSPGGDIKIHGIVNGYEKETEDWMKADWTWGCIAVTNPEMDEIYDHVKMGAPINILP